MCADTKPRPLVWLPVDHRCLGQAPLTMPFMVLGEKYARAVQQCANAQPVLFPLAGPEAIGALLDQVAGVMLTGSPSNVHPSHFDQSVHNPALPLDPARDALTLPLVQACVAKGVPLLGICRGFQEINVALGGSLHQAVHEQPGLHDHREPKDQPYETQYAPSHPLHLVPDRALATWAGTTQVWVNSLHGQGVNRLAPGLVPLAHAPDGLVEAFEIGSARAFAVGVQFHPEWQCASTPFYAAIFKAFGQAVHQRHAQMQASKEASATGR